MKGAEPMREIKTYKIIDKEGRITIPKLMRDNLKLNINDEVKLDMQGNKIIISNENQTSKENKKISIKL